MRGAVSILAALCVLLSGAYCACAAAAQPAANVRAHACCGHGSKSPVSPERSHGPARDCPHCDGSAVTAAPINAQELQHTCFLPALVPDVPIGAVLTARIAPAGPPDAVRFSAPPAPTLLGLHCALTL